MEGKVRVRMPRVKLGGDLNLLGLEFVTSVNTSLRFFLEGMSFNRVFKLPSLEIHYFSLILVIFTFNSKF